MNSICHVLICLYTIFQNMNFKFLFDYWDDQNESNKYYRARVNDQMYPLF